MYAARDGAGNIMTAVVVTTSKDITGEYNLPHGFYRVCAKEDSVLSIEGIEGDGIYFPAGVVDYLQFPDCKITVTGSLNFMGSNLE